jgi:hypothetical protein
MDDSAWMVLADLELWAEVGHSLAFGAWVIERLRAGAVPEAVSGRVEQAVLSALQDGAARPGTERVRLTLLKPPPTGPTTAGSGWGFFLVEKPADDADPYRIEVFLYQESG